MCSDEDVYLSDPSDDEESKSVDVGLLQSMTVTAI